MEDTRKGAFKDLVGLAIENQKKLLEYEAVKIFNTRVIADDHKVEVMVARWKKNGALSLEVRNMYYNTKLNWWKMGKRASIGIEELQVIEKNIKEIAQYLRGSSS